MSGNVPPWLKGKLDVASTPQKQGKGSNMLGPSIEGFLRSKEIEKQRDRGKSRKLGSTFDHCKPNLCKPFDLSLCSSKA
ncbi:hypothetical protein DSO57_1021617 [Entomophthora muscae]|uniref:Uncharacterized protein n=1 Tax=Entomophthora muscae TaxID=34485 RepID=A0ACC2RI08_9FUNG|nr:hypothetical protein DSO57_1021617 [Entomophthora muscae]